MADLRLIKPVMRLLVTELSSVDFLHERVRIILGIHDEFSIEATTIRFLCGDGSIIVQSVHEEQVPSSLLKDWTDGRSAGPSYADDSSRSWHSPFH